MRSLPAYLWAAPASAIGLALAAPCIAAGGRARIVSGVLEVSAESLFAALRANRALPMSIAITFGHVVLASEAVLLERFRAHEHIHVAQYERWGPLFLPLYLGSSLLQLILGRDPYLQNHFEREAFGADPVRGNDQGGNPAA